MRRILTNSQRQPDTAAIPSGTPREYTVVSPSEDSLYPWKSGSKSSRWGFSLILSATIFSIFNKPRHSQRWRNVTVAQPAPRRTADANNVNKVTLGPCAAAAWLAIQTDISQPMITDCYHYLILLFMCSVQLGSPAQLQYPFKHESPCCKRLHRQTVVSRASCCQGVIIKRL